MKKILLGLMSVLLCLGLMGSAFAYFTDVVTSTGNTFTAGTLPDLLILDSGTWDPDGFANSVDHTWEMSILFNGVMIPGTSEVTNNVLLQEVGGNIPANHVEVAFTDSISPNTLLPQALGKWLHVTQWMYGSYNMLNRITATPGWDVNGNGFIDLDDLVRSVPINAAGGPLDNLPTPVQLGIFASMSMTIAFDAGATNDVQGATLTMVVTFSLMQSASQ